MTDQERIAVVTFEALRDGLIGGLDATAYPVQHDWPPYYAPDDRCFHAGTGRARWAPEAPFVEAVVGSRDILVTVWAQYSDAEPAASVTVAYGATTDTIGAAVANIVAAANRQTATTV